MCTDLVQRRHECLSAQLMRGHIQPDAIDLYFPMLMLIISVFPDAYAYYYYMEN